MSALEHARNLLEKAKENLEKAGNLLAVGILHTKHESFIIPAPFKDAHEKQFYASLFRLTAKKEKAQEFFFISEIWYTQTKRLPDGSFPDMSIPPKDLPERREAILVSFEAKEPKAFGLLTQFFHKINDKVVWGEYKEDFGLLKSAGLFTHIFEEVDNPSRN